MVDMAPDMVAGAPGPDSDDEEPRSRRKRVAYDVEASRLHPSGLYYRDSDSELELETDSETDENKESLGEQHTTLFNLHVVCVRPAPQYAQ